MINSISSYSVCQIEMFPLQASKSDCTNPCETSGEEFHCDANAHCLLIPETSDFKCECKPGYNGTGHECTDVCLNYCDNEGICFKDSRGQPSCRCSGSFTGKTCAEKSDFFYITGGIAGGVILVIFIALLVWMICVRFVFPFIFKHHRIVRKFTK